MEQQTKADAEADVEIRANTEVNDVIAEGNITNLDAVAEGDDSQRVHVTVKMKLNSFLMDKNAAAIKAHLEAVVLDGNQLMGEAYAFANLHILRLLEGGQPLPQIDRSFYYRCLMAVSISKVRPATLGNFQDSITAFDACRDVATAKVNVLGYNQLVADLSILMATMATNHLWMNLEKRLKRYLGWAHPAIKPFHNAIIKAVVRAPKKDITVIMRAAMKTSNDKMKAKLVEASRLAAEFRGLMSLPNSRQTKTQAHLTLPLYHRILRDTEAGKEAFAQTSSDDTSQKKKFGGRLFSLLPLKRAFTTSYIPISTMFWIAILKQKKLEVFEGDGRDEDGYSLWAKYCNIKAVETQRRSFTGRIMTDGYAVSVLVSPKTSSSTATGKSDSTIEQIQEMWLEAEAQNREVVRVGIDPGFTDVITACFSDGRKPVSYSSAQYYEKAKISHSIRKTSKFNMQTQAETNELLASGGCLTSSVNMMISYITVYLRVLVPLLKNRLQQKYRKLRFLRHIYKQKVVNEIVDLIVGPSGTSGAPLVLVGFGDWSGGHESPISRKHAGPIQTIKEKIGRRANAAIKPIDEHKSSQVDCQLWQKLTNMKAVTYRRGKDGKVTAAFNNKVHKVLHCKPSDVRIPGRVTTWNRDVNAAYNILTLLEFEILGLERPEPFRRSSNKVGPRLASAPRGASGNTGVDAVQVIRAPPAMGPLCELQ